MRVTPTLKMGITDPADLYLENFAVAMDRLAEAWREVEGRYGFPFESPDISARAVMGTALILALESHHSKKFDRDRAVALISEGTVKGFFPAIQPKTAGVAEAVDQWGSSPNSGR